MSVLDSIKNNQYSPKHRHGLAKAKAGSSKEFGNELRKRKSEFPVVGSEHCAFREGAGSLEG